MSSPLYRFLYSIQEEAHRFAITYHRSLRSKALKKSSLDNIEGVGPKRKMSLMKHFKTIDNIKKAEISELLDAPSMNNLVAENIYNYYRSDHEVDND